MGNAQLETCGMCKFAHIDQGDLEKIVCFGAPPTPCVVAGRQVAAGVQYQAQNIRPVLSRNEPACAVFKHRILLGEATTN